MKKKNASLIWKKVLSSKAKYPEEVSERTVKRMRKFRKQFTLARNKNSLN